MVCLPGCKTDAAYWLRLDTLSRSLRFRGEFVGQRITAVNCRMPMFYFPLMYMLLP